MIRGSDYPTHIYYNYSKGVVIMQLDYNKDSCYFDVQNLHEKKENSIITSIPNRVLAGAN